MYLTDRSVGFLPYYITCEIPCKEALKIFCYPYQHVRLAKKQGAHIVRPPAKYL